MRFYTGRDQYTILEMDNLGSVGDATVSFKLMLRQVPKSTTEMYFDAEYHLKRKNFLGNSYTIQGSTTAPLPSTKTN